MGLWGAQIVGVIGVLVTVVPGPDMAVVTQHAIASGRREAARVAAGVVTGLLVWGVFCVVGLAAVLAASAEAYAVVKLLGAAYLLFLGARALFSARHGVPLKTSHRTTGVGNGYWTGLATNVLNPKIAVFYVGLLPALAPGGLPAAAGMGLLVLVHAVLSLAWLACVAHAVSAARSFFERPRVRVALERVTGVVLIGFGLRVVVEAD
ncbi:LysE family translocator [Streptomyces torulosus]|uniref:LysE family translocator n=1 Tax=Streptomyces torulosus TaxID=68276 RepID=UPI000A749B1C|nr:LysE family translocator [Streptomyces torulosus]